MHRIFDDLSAAGLYGCIAGGFAVSPELAGDIDVFVFATPEDILNTKLKTVWQDDNTEMWGEYCTCELCKGDYGSTGTQVLLKCQPFWAPRPIQLIATSAVSTMDLLNDFDISTHRKAYIRGGGELSTMENKWTAPDEPMVVYGENPGTLMRIEKLKKRYGITEVNYAPGI